MPNVLPHVQSLLAAALILASGCFPLPSEPTARDLSVNDSLLSVGDSALRVNDLALSMNDSAPSVSDMATGVKLSMPLSLPTAYPIWQLGVGDLDNDGKPDVVAAGAADVAPGRGTFVAFNNGARTFSAPSLIAAVGGYAGDDPRISLGDFNRDGLLDVVLDAYAYPNPILFTVQNLGGRKFAAERQVPYAFLHGQQMTSFTTADLNHDGNPDLILCGPGVDLRGDPGPQPPKEPRVLVQFGDGKGGFGAPVGFAADSPRWVTAADLDLDGWADVVTAPFAPGHVLFNDKGILLAPTNPFGDLIQRVAVGDMNGDGLPDIVAIGLPGGINVTLNAGKREFWMARPFDGTPTVDFALGDMNHDGRLDIVGSDGAGGYYVTLGLGGGTLGDPVILQGISGGTLAIADLDGDKKDDLVIGDGKNLTIYFNDSP